MAKLSFYARQDQLVNARTGEVLTVGSYAQYVNRKYDPETRGWPAQPEPFVCDESSAIGRHCLRLMLKGTGRKNPPLWPVDDYTARACGWAKAIPVTLTEGVWVEAPQQTPKPARAGKADS